METRPLLLKAVETRDGENKPREMYLHLVKHHDGTEEPISLGTGRSAVVFLATEYQSIGPNAGFRAVKFLRDDPDDQVAHSLAVRFLQEALSLQTKIRDISSLVSFHGWGAIVRDLARRGRANSVKEFWWEEFFNDVEMAHVSANDSPEYRQMKVRFNLQGPFYCLELCHGTLEQLLERNEPWINLKVYQHDAGSARVLRESATEIGSDLEEFAKRYLKKDDNNAPLSPADLAQMSGYDILNAFRTESVIIRDSKGEPIRDKGQIVTHDPNIVRSNAVLTLFNSIVESIQHLHKVEEAHRDLKPGNIFLKHTPGKPLKVDVKLADLGYVTYASTIKEGYTLKEGTEQAPGSPFYRAPEQADLPIEVRINIEEPNIASGKSSKIGNIRPNDWLFVADLFGDNVSYHLSQQEDANESGLVTEIQSWCADNPNATPQEIESMIDARLTEFRNQLIKKTHVSRTGNPDEQNTAEAILKLRGVYRDNRFFRIVDAKTINDKSGEFSLNLGTRSIVSQEKHDLQAQISKSTGFHTDVYSLGAILYDLASGGRNPEHFYTYCLKVFTDQFGVESKLVPQSIDEIMDILCPKKEKRELHDRLRLAWQLLWTNNVDALIEDILKSSYVNPTEEEARKKIRDYRFRTFDVVNTLLKDKRGEDIPREIVDIIVRCMLRDKIGSFCSSDQGWSAISSDGRKTIVEKIEDAVGKLLDTKFRMPDNNFFTDLEDDLLFRLRALSFSHTPDTSEQAKSDPATDGDNVSEPNIPAEGNELASREAVDGSAMTSTLDDAAAVQSGDAQIMPLPDSSDES